MKKIKQHKKKEPTVNLFIKITNYISNLSERTLNIFDIFLSIFIIITSFTFFIAVKNCVQNSEYSITLKFLFFVVTLCMIISVINVPNFCIYNLIKKIDELEDACLLVRILKHFTFFMCMMVFISCIITYVTMANIKSQKFILKLDNELNFSGFDVKEDFDKKLIIQELHIITTTLNKTMPYTVRYCIDTSQKFKNQPRYFSLVKADYYPDITRYCLGQTIKDFKSFRILMRCMMITDTIESPMYCNSYEFRYQKYQEYFRIFLFFMILTFLWSIKNFSFEATFFDYLDAEGSEQNE